MILKRREWERVQKIRLARKEKEMKANLIKDLFPKGDRQTRMMLVKKLEKNPSFKKQLKNMKELFHGKK